MKLYSVLVVLFLAMVMLVGCGSKAPETGVTNATALNVPNWFVSPPQDPNYLFSSTTAMSRELQLAIDKAKQMSRADLGTQLEVKVEGMTKNFTEEVGANQDTELLTQFSEASKSVVATVLKSARVKDQEITVENGIYRAYVLMELPLGAANAALMQQIKNNQNMYTRFRSTTAFGELETEVEKFEKFKKEQGMIQ